MTAALHELVRGLPLNEIVPIETRAIPKQGLMKYRNVKCIVVTEIITELNVQHLFITSSSNASVALGFTVL